MSESQFGFRKGRSTADCVFVLHGLIELLLAQGKQLYCVFIDYEKAYDYINRAALFSKLLKEGVSSKVIRLMEDLYSKMKLSVRGDDENRVFASNCGLFQGERTSPIFFSLYVNDLEREMGHQSIGSRVQDILIRILMFADDMAIISVSKKGLQIGLDRLHNYCLKWGISINTIKTKVVVFRKGGRIGKNDIWTLGGVVLETVSSFKYLGCILTPSGSFSGCIKELTISARRALFGLKKCLHSHPELLPSSQISLFNTLVSPILYYCCEIWGLCKADPIEKLHLSFLKSLLGVKASTPNCFIYGELGVFPMYLERQVRVIKFWMKCINPDEYISSFVRNMYYEMLALMDSKPEAVTWASLVRDTLNNCGLGNFWHSQNVGSEKIFLSLFKQRIYDIYLQNWISEVKSTSSGRLYQHIKTSFYHEPYLNMYDRNLRIAITKIRLSSHLFYIERGRWGRQNVAREDRKCNVCDVVEDEFHCLLECPRFINERSAYIPENEWRPYCFSRNKRYVFSPTS